VNTWRPRALGVCIAPAKRYARPSPCSQEAARSAPVPAVTRYAYESFWIARAVTKVCLCAGRSDIHVHEVIDVFVGVAEELLEAPLAAGGGCVGAELRVEAEVQVG
jgi:hypothetical protein